ncbi:OmpA family protein [Eisenibacter elegans]|jgi:outer membrane protein OmpA-like peptidoglycan-associated protein|uniref:OmpA family protein n=1 Tax=Eisenibacter elegans TaxID=997 RepID=UPI000685EB69|nr:OmpA family protein [Eisenibacter elegans]
MNYLVRLPRPLLLLLACFSLSLGASQQLWAQRDTTRSVMSRIANANTEVSFKEIANQKTKDGNHYILYRLSRQRIRAEADSRKNSVYVPEYYKRDPDGDGVVGDADKCPSTPSKVWVYVGSKDSVSMSLHNDLLVINGRDSIYVHVNEFGCFPDDDGDGVPNFNDRCPDTKKGEPVDKYGCTLKDSDGDGIPDIYDDCPDKPGSKKNRGCPDPDRDGDGIPDKEDLCPDEPGPKSNKGCPELIKEEEKEILKAASRVQFNTASAVILREFYPELDRVADLLKKYPKARLHLEGHTDSDGTEEANQVLSEQRAASVRQYLINKGIEPERITSAGFGELQPIDTNNTPQGKRNNRRVEMSVF